ncbi:MAG: cupin domain-containing protein [Deltaproteobacteria bacterium]|nr:cupin domain-containing protein [Deltaproteobacteria bacterium]
MNFAKHLCLFLLLLPLLGCTYPKGKIYSYNDAGLFSKTWREIVRGNPISKDENIKVTPIFNNQDSSHFIIQIRDREKPHIHETHDLTVIVKKGKGVLHLGKDELPMRRGDIAFIPRGILHYFVNTDSEPSVAYVIFTPFYDGRDMKPVDDGATN